MFIRPITVNKNGKRHGYWALVESYRTSRGPRQRVVSYLGQAKGNNLAQRGYSRDHRGDCKQVCIGLVVSKCGMPLGYEIFAGNRHDSTTVEEIVETMERRYGKADRICVMDRGMVSQENIDLLKEDKRRYIIGTPKSMLTQNWPEIFQSLLNGRRHFHIHRPHVSFFLTHTSLP